MNKKAIWASAHTITEEQKSSLEAEGFDVLFLQDINSKLLSKLSNLELESDRETLVQSLVREAMKVGSSEFPATIIQPAGDPAIQFQLGRIETNAPVWYAFTERVSEDIPQEDGSIRKVSVFKHAGWVQ